jgi:hypothetical protein
MGENSNSSTERLSEEYKLWLQPRGRQIELDDQNRITDVVVMRFGYALHSIYGTTEVVLTGNNAQENKQQIERAFDALENILGSNKRLAASYIWGDGQLTVEKQRRTIRSDSTDLL